MWEKLQEQIKRSKTNSSTHTDVVPSLQEACTGPAAPLLESNEKKSKNLPNVLSGKFRQLSAVDFQFRRYQGLCFICEKRFHPNHVCSSEKVEHIGDIGSIPEGESIGKNGTVIDGKRSEEVEAVEPVFANEDGPTLDVIAHSDPQQQNKNEEVGITVECNETKNTEVDIVEYVVIEDDDRESQAKQLEVLVEHLLGFVDGSIVFRISFARDYSELLSIF